MTRYNKLKMEEIKGTLIEVEEALKKIDTSDGVDHNLMMARFFVKDAIRELDLSLSGDRLPDTSTQEGQLEATKRILGL